MEGGKEGINITCYSTGDTTVKIIYEDNHLLVVEKPVNVLTQGDITGDKDLLTILKEYVKEKYSKPGNVYLGLVHRLDRPVGGVMVFARTSKAASRLSEQIRKGDFEKEYLAVVHGEFKLKNAKGTLEHYLLKDNKTNIVRVAGRFEKEAKKAILEYEVLESTRVKEQAMSLVRIKLLTGRPHQIRVQFAATGHPLHGDMKYNPRYNSGPNPKGSEGQKGEQLALWSHRITIEHPVKKEKMSFSCNPPDKHPWNAFSKSWLLLS